MTLVEQIRTDRNEARKGSEDRRETLTVLLSEVLRIGKDNGNRETTDEEAVQVTKRMINVCQDTIQLLENSTGSENKANLIDRWYAEKAVYEKYIPKQLSELELTTIIDDIMKIKNLSEPKDIGIIMAALKSKFTGLYDGRMASDIVREKLST